MKIIIPNEGYYSTFLYLMKVITVYLMKVIIPDDGYSRIVLCTINLNILHLISDDFLTKMMFISSLSPVVCSTTHVLFMVVCA